MDDNFWVGLFGFLTVSMLVLGAVKCSHMERDAWRACVEKVGNPLECSAARRSAP